MVEWIGNDSPGKLAVNSPAEPLASERTRTRTRIRPRAPLPTRTYLLPLAFGGLGLALLLAGPSRGSCGWLSFAALAVAALLLGCLPVRLPGDPLPISALPLAVVPGWLLCGGWEAAGLGLVALVGMQLLSAAGRLPTAWQLGASLAGVGVGATLGQLAATAPLGPADLARGIGFSLGLWLAQTVAERLAPERRLSVPSAIVNLLTHAVLLPPGLLLAQIGSSQDKLPFVAGLGLAVGVMILVRAITNSEARAVELEAQVSSSVDARERLELIVDHVPEAMLGIDLQGRVRWLNRTAADWLGEGATSAVGQPAGLALPVRTTEGRELDHADLLARSALEGRPLHEEGLLEGAPGAPERVLVSYSAGADPLDAEQGLVLLRDASVITDSLREQEQLAVHLSHELRAPLTTILGYAQLLANQGSRDQLPDARTEFAQRISESGDYMLRLVNNLLDLGRLTRNDAEQLPLSHVDTVGLTRGVIEDQRPQADARAQELSFRGPPGPVSLLTSDLALRQILTNLVANGIKYTRQGGHVALTLSDEPDAVTWRVTDDGIGLTPDELSKLFTRFFRSQRPEARLIKGTGLGLALTKALVEQLDGTIEVQSALDQGSTFTVRLPRRPEPDGRAAGVAAPPS